MLPVTKKSSLVAFVSNSVSKAGRIYSDHEASIASLGCPYIAQNDSVNKSACFLPVLYLLGAKLMHFCNLLAVNPWESAIIVVV